MVIAFAACILLCVSLSAEAAPPSGSGSTESRKAPLVAPGQVIWDENAVPHIFAHSLRDAYCLLGWAHARDRLWQMEMLRRMGQGRVAEILGPPWLASDIRARILGLYHEAKQDYAAAEPAVREDVNAYVGCINAYLADPRRQLSEEFKVFGVSPEPWQPEDTFIWARLIALQLSGNYSEEVLRARLRTEVTPATLDALFPGSRREAAASSGGASGSVDWARFAAHLPPPIGSSGASNE